MKKIAIGLCVAGLFALGGLYWTFSNLGSLVRAGIERFGPEVLGASVTVAKVSLSPFSGKGAIKGLVIGNPKGFKTESAFELSEVRIGIEPKSLASDTIVVREIVVKGPKVTYEMARGASNMATLLRNVESFAAKAGVSGGEASSSSSKEESGPSKKIRIGLFQFADGETRVSAKILRGKALTLPLPSITLKDIGGNDGTTPAKAAAKIFKSLTQSITSTAHNGISQVGKQVREGVETTVKGVGEKLKGLFK